MIAYEIVQFEGKGINTTKLELSMNGSTKTIKRGCAHTYTLVLNLGMSRRSYIAHKDRKRVSSSSLSKTHGPRVKPHSRQKVVGVCQLVCHAIIPHG